jgi:hypothetical protein
MARSQVAEKISNLLMVNPDSWDESKVVYFFVELRKLLDHIRELDQQDLPHLRFYCDWIVHISKDRIDPITLGVIKNMEQGIVQQIGSSFSNLGREAVDFAYFRSLNEEIISILEKEGIDASYIKTEDSWVHLVATLVKVLEEQPLNLSPSSGLNIKKLIFLTSAPGCVVMRMDFITPINDRNGVPQASYTLKNAF